MYPWTFCIDADGFLSKNTDWRRQVSNPSPMSERFGGYLSNQRMRYHNGDSLASAARCMLRAGDRLATARAARMFLVVRLQGN
jgi:hypothetical protein